MWEATVVSLIVAILVSLFNAVFLLHPGLLYLWKRYVWWFLIALILAWVIFIILKAIWEAYESIRSLTEL